MDKAQSLAIGAITIDPNKNTTLFVGTGEGNLSLDSFFGVGLYIIQNATTTAELVGPFHAPEATNPDAGVTAVFAGRSIPKILVDPTDSNRILVSSSSGLSGASGDALPGRPPRGVYLSTNALAAAPTFARQKIQTANPNRLVSDMVMDPGNANKIVIHVFGVATPGDGGVWVSTSGIPWAGTASWTQTLLDNSNDASNPAPTPAHPHPPPHHIATTPPFHLPL